MENKDYCHIGRGPLCMKRPIAEMSLKYKKALVLFNNFTRWISYYNNPACVLKELNYDYYNAVIEATKGEPSSHFITWLLVIIGAISLVIVIIVIIACLKCRGKDEEDDEDTPLTNSLK